MLRFFFFFFFLELSFNRVDFIAIALVLLIVHIKASQHG